MSLLDGETDVEDPRSFATLSPPNQLVASPRWAQQYESLLRIIGQVKKMIVYRPCPPRFCALPAELLYFLIPVNVLYVLRSVPIRPLMSVAVDLGRRSPQIESYMYSVGAIGLKSERNYQLPDSLCCPTLVVSLFPICIDLHQNDLARCYSRLTIHLHHMDLSQSVQNGSKKR